MKTRLKKNTFNIWVAVLGVLVVFASVLAFTGSWFTDSKVMKGNLNAPAIQPYIVEKSGSTYTKIAQNSLEWSSSADSKSIYIQFPSDENNVKYELVRFLVNVEWGTKENGVFVQDSTLTVDGFKYLTPTIANSSNWTRGEASSMATLEYIAQHSGYTVAQLQSLGMTESDLATFFGVNTSDIPTYYYYNNIVKLAEQTTPLQIISGFTFSGGSEYSGKVAKINIIVEAASVSDKTLGGTENGVEFEGLWTTTENDAHRAPEAWVNNIKEKRLDLLGF